MKTEIAVINKVAKYLGVPAGTITLDSNETPIRSMNGQKYTGTAAILLKMASESKTFQWSNNEEQYRVYEWLEFSQQFGRSLNLSSSTARVMLKELNTYLENCSYLVGYSLSLVDVILYYITYDLIASLSPQDREANVHICRWFDHIQFNEAVRQDHQIINFSSNYITNITKVLC